MVISAEHQKLESTEVVPKKIINLFGINYAYNYNIANNSFA
jgi:hypothetical protein